MEPVKNEDDYFLTTEMKKVMTDSDYLQFSRNNYGRFLLDGQPIEIHMEVISHADLRKEMVPRWELNPVQFGGFINEQDRPLKPYKFKERIIMKLLTKIKDWTPPVRESSLRQLTYQARIFGDCHFSTRFCHFCHQPWGTRSAAFL